jgi:2-oxo-4-hydroxy-4-carboxy-5-ureidoimidazoline decarboxylase
MDRLSIDAVNRMPPDQFVQRFGAVFEHAPWAAERAVAVRPFADRAALHAAMVDIVRRAGEAERLALLCGHPELGDRQLIAAGRLTASSQSEQQGAGLDRLDPADAERLRRLNNAYRARFGFPFILAVKGRSKDEILAALEARIGNDRGAELDTAFAEVAKIAGFRLADLVME